MVGSRPPRGERRHRKPRDSGRTRGRTGAGSAPAPARASHSPRPGRSASPVRDRRRRKPPPRVLEGVVKAPDGKPVENARVTYRTEDGMFGRPPATVKTDAAGRFRVELKAITRLNVRVEADGFASRVLESVKPGPPITVTLDHGRTLEGTIRDAAGQPVPGARVVARASTADGNALGPHGGSDHGANRCQGPLPTRGPRARALHRVGRPRGRRTSLPRERAAGRTARSRPWTRFGPRGRGRGCCRPARGGGSRARGEASFRRR